MKKTVCLLLALCLLLGGCAGSSQETTAQTTAEPTTQVTTEATTEVTTEPTTAPTEPPLPYNHPLTGIAIAEPVTNRPFAVVINNIKDAQPLHGIGQADMLFEITAEGGGSITRCLGIYTDIEQVTKLGAIRSSRTYFIDLANAFGSVFVHAGGSTYAYNELKKGVIDNLDGLYGSNYFYRDQARKQAGYALEHTLFTSGEQLLAYAEKKGFETTSDEPLDFGYQFAEEPDIMGDSARRIEMHFSGKCGKGTILEYDETIGLYFATQKFGSKEMEFIDGNTETTVSFRNVILMFSKTTSDGYRMFAQLTGEGTGYFACDGVIVPIKWSRSKDTDPFVYTLEDGTPITLGVGTTYVGVLATKSPVTFE